MPAKKWKYALRALRSEVIDFRFDYPLEIVPEAGPKDSLEYYLYSERLAWDVMRLDPEGIPRAHARLMGEYYKPALAAWWGLVNLGHYLRHKDQSSLERFLIQINWLERNAIVRPDGAVVWPNNFDCLQGATLLKAPWVSAYDQGLAISALVRGWRISGRKELRDLLTNSARVFAMDVADNGVRISTEQGALYTELPGSPPPGILDGFMTSLLGLYDLSVELEDSEVEQLFMDGIRGLTSTLPLWDYKGRWSWYGSRAYLSPPCYHQIHRSLLHVLAQLSGKATLADYAKRWDPRRLSAWERSEIYLQFLVTKNAHRIKHRTWERSLDSVRIAVASKAA